MLSRPVDRVYRLKIMGVVLAALVAVSVGAFGQQAEQQTERPKAEPQQTERPEDVVDRLPISLDKIRKELEEAPPPPSSLRIGPLPTFRVTVEGRRKSLLPEFQETLRQPWQPTIPGGIHNKEILDLITPPQARPFGAFTNGDLVEVAGTALLQGLGMQALRKGLNGMRGAVRDWREGQIRREVEEELAAFKRANGLVDPLPPPPASGKKPPEQKPPDPK